MVREIMQEAESRMHKSIDGFKAGLSKLRTGRAHPSLLEQIHVDYYGQQSPLSQVANVAIEDARTLSVTPWEKNMVPIIEKAIRQSDLGLNPATAGLVIRIPLPPLTAERRKQFTKVVGEEAERARVAVRNVRREANAEFKELVKNKSISEDEERKAQEQLQKLTDESVAKIDQISKQKQQDLMEI